MSHYTVVAITPTSTSWIPGYLETVGSLVARHGGRYLARTARHERLEGEGETPAVYTIVQWPSRDAANAFYNDPDYVPHREARRAGATTTYTNIEGVDDFGVERIDAPV
jgi:uncharacterized protein (DUF1330 family)